MIFRAAILAFVATVLPQSVSAQDSGAAPAPGAEAPAAEAAPPEPAVAGPGDPAVASEENGDFFDADMDPTFKIEPDGTVDWSVYSGFRRYHADCHVCHGPDGEGSSYAPRLVDSVERQTYAEFLEVVASGRMNVQGGKQNVMPAFGTNVNVMCYVDDIYVYLRARAQGDLPRGRPGKRADKSAAAAEAEEACLGT
jgi:methanol metabolism-related c-type cytochrome